jgi:hypothetical protein
MKIKTIFLSIVLVLLSTNVFAQKQDAAAVVQSFYKFHLSHEGIFNKREVSRRYRFFTPRLRQLFNAELKRQRNYQKKYPDNKPYFDVLPFQPIEFCEKDYRVGAVQTARQTASVRVNFVYGKSSCDANDGTRISYRILLLKTSGKWLINDVVYDNGSTLTKDFGNAQKVK